MLIEFPLFTAQILPGPVPPEVKYRFPSGNKQEVFTLFQVLFSFESNFTQNGAKTFSSSSLIHLLAEFGPMTLTIKNHFICNVNALVFSAAVSNCPCWGRKNKYCKLGKDQLFGG